MTTIEAFGQFRPFTIGFDSIFDKLSETLQYHTVVLTFHITSLREVKTLGLLKWQLLVSIKRMLILNSKKII